MQNLPSLTAFSDFPKKMVLKKHVAMIHVSSKQSLLERKIGNIFMTYAYDNLNKSEEHFIRMADLKHWANYNSKNNEHLKNTIKDLASTLVEWNLTAEEYTEKHEIWGVSTTVASVEIINGTLIKYSFSPPMRKYLHVPEKFGRIDLETQRKITSKHTLILYENCKRYVDTFQGRTKKMNTSLWQKIFDVEDYSFKDFIHKVVKKAVKELNGLGDITVTPHFKKHKNIVPLGFFTVKKQNQENTKQASDLIKSSSPILETLEKDIGWTKETSNKAIVKYGESYINEKLRYCLEQNAKKEICNKGAYLAKALKENYKSPQIIVQEKRQKKDIEKAKEVLLIKKEEEEEKEAYDLKKKKFEVTLSKLEPTEKEALIKKFEDGYINKQPHFSPVVKAFNRSGLSDKIAFSTFMNWAEKDPELQFLFQ